jgi:hypothetical protein
MTSTTHSQADVEMELTTHQTISGADAIMEDKKDVQTQQQQPVHVHDPQYDAFLYAENDDEVNLDISVVTAQQASSSHKSRTPPAEPASPKSPQLSSLHLQTQVRDFVESNLIELDDPVSETKCATAEIPKKIDDDTNMEARKRSSNTRITCRKANINL